MMQSQLTLVQLLERAGKLFSKVETVSRRPDSWIFYSKYAEFYRRARCLAAALQKYGIRRGDRVATLMWNHRTYLEAYFGIPVVGGILHALNLRSHPDELAYVVNDAQDRFLIVDDVLLPLFEKIKDRVKFDHVLVVPFSGCRTVPHDYDDYEQLMQPSSGTCEYAELSEDEPAAMCYTARTAGPPKAVVYSHRALALHACSISLPDHLSISRTDTILPVTSMFQANGWGMPLAAVLNGSKLVFPGSNLQPDQLLDLLSSECVTLTGAGPAVWLGVIDALEKQPERWPLASGLRIVVAGAVCPASLFRRFDKFGVQVIQAWGMTETTPIGAVSRLKLDLASLSEDDRYEINALQGLTVPFVETRAMNESEEAPWRAATSGEVDRADIQLGRKVAFADCVPGMDFLQRSARYSRLE
ncbi:MAG TPA: AMP-binding protein [Candidatus Saccharimonadales bacterium]|nr:AMP-binding protein [Candidatus Saccharimonadales bacterium]